MSDQQLSEKLHKPINRKFQKRKVYSSLIDNIYGGDPADMQLKSRFNEGISFLLCVIDIFRKYAWVIPLKDKNCFAITNSSQKILDESNHQPNKIWLDKGS